MSPPYTNAIWVADTSGERKSLASICAMADNDNNKVERKHIFFIIADLALRKDTEGK